MQKYGMILNSDFAPQLVAERELKYSSPLNNSDRLYDFVCAELNMDILAEEYMYMIALNSKLLPIGVFEISHGNVHMSCAGPREVFTRALLAGATAIELVHNHPSGDCHPSKEDIQITEKLKAAGELLGIAVVEHLVVGRDKYFSFAEEKYL